MSIQLNRFARPAIYVFLFTLLGIPGCGSGSSDSGDQIDLTTAPTRTRGTRTTHKPTEATEHASLSRGRDLPGSGLATANREWIATYDAYTQTVKEATEVFRSITDDVSAEAALPRLRELWQIRSGEQDDWSEVDLQGMLDNDEVAADWEAAYDRFHTAIEELRAEQGRVYGASRKRSPMREAIVIFKLV